MSLKKTDKMRMTNKMGISFEQMRDSYSMAKSGCKFYDGMTEIHPEDIVKRLDRLSKLEQTPAFSNVIGGFEPSINDYQKAIYDYEKTQFVDVDAIDTTLEAFFTNYFIEGARWMAKRIKEAQK
jgi:hypothetical protein